MKKILMTVVVSVETIFCSLIVCWQEITYRAFT
jgi:hypothetical protein